MFSRTDKTVDIFPQTRADMFPLTIGVEAITLLERTN